MLEAQSELGIFVENAKNGTITGNKISGFDKAIHGKELAGTKINENVLEGRKHKRTRWLGIFGLGAIIPGLIVACLTNVFGWV